MAEPKMTLQERADEVLVPEYRQPLKTLREALAVHGWAEVDKPECCDQPVKITQFMGDTYRICCESCGRFIFDTTAPYFPEGKAFVCLLDLDQYDGDRERVWIAGTRVEDAKYYLAEER